MKRVELYIDILKKGIHSFDEYTKKSNKSCDPSAMYEIVSASAKQYMSPKKMINKSLNVTIDLHDEINDVTVAKTMKNLFCGVCLIYDCGLHMIDVKTTEVILLIS